MNSELGQALSQCSTSAQWSTLDAVATKVSKKLKISPRELDEFMVSVGDEALMEYGIWRTSFGAKYMPIVLVNTAFGRAFQRIKEAETMKNVTINDVPETMKAVSASPLNLRLLCTCGVASNPSSASGISYSSSAPGSSSASRSSSGLKNVGERRSSTPANIISDEGTIDIVTSSINTNAIQRYFGSTDYNAGRHATLGSGHKPMCLLWRPPTTSHLHSWRRGFDGR